MKRKNYRLIGLIILLAGFLTFSNCDNQQHQNIDRILGKENPYVSIVKGDSVWRYEKSDSNYHFLEKIATEEKILKDIRIINRNQNTLEIWLIASLILNLICIALVLRLLLKKSPN